MKTFKRVMAMVLCLVMVVGMLPATALAATENVVKVEHDGVTTYYADLQKAFDGFAPSNNTYGGKYVITLLDNISGMTAVKNLQYPTEVLDITLDLNGFTITGNGTNIAVNVNLGSSNSGTSSGTFTIKDSSGNNSGKITGGKGGVYVYGKNATLNFQGGTITGNHGASKGGGILVGATTFFNMTGGVITGNSVTPSSSSVSAGGQGGGVFANYATISGGVITGNTASKGSSTNVQSGRGGGVCTDITRTTGYSTLTIADGVVFGNTADNAGDDVMAQGNGNVKFTLIIGKENWYVDGWKGTKATAGYGEAARYNETNPVAYKDGGFTDVKNVIVGLKYVAPAAPSVPTYSVTVNSAENGTVTADPTEDLKEGDEVTLTVTPDDGYELDSLTVTDAAGAPVTVSNNKFTMPASDVTVSASFTEVPPPAPVAPEAPTQFGENVTPDLVRVICDSDEDHAPLTIKWQHQSTKVRDWVSGVVWSDEYNTWIVPIRIDSIDTYYLWAQYEDTCNEINHDLAPDDPVTGGESPIDTYLKWDANEELWVTMDGNPIDVHVICKTVPDAPTALPGSAQIQVKGDLDHDGIYGESKQDCALGISELYTTTIPKTSGYTMGEVYGSREEGFFVDVTVTLENGDLYITNWVEQRAPGKDYVYNWDLTPATVTFTLKYDKSLTGTLHGDYPGDWVANYSGYKVGEAFVEENIPAPTQKTVTEQLVAVICDSDPTRHETVYGKWYPQHCNVLSGAEVVWNEELATWTVDVKIGGLYIMYVSQLEDANGGTTHELVEDITTVFTTLKWDYDLKLWVPVEPIELHTTCKTKPDAPAYEHQIDGYQVKVHGMVDGVEKAWTTSIPEGGYTLSEVYGSREEGFFVDVTFTITENDVYQQNWIDNRAAGLLDAYVYDWTQTPTTVTFTLEYNGSLTGTLHGNRYASNTNIDWVLPTTGKDYGVVAEAYLEAATFTVILKPARGTVSPTTVEVTYGEEVGELPVPTRTGYTFTGWVDEEGNPVTEDTVYTVIGNSTYTATWVINTYTVTFDSNGGSTVASQTVTHGETAAKPASPTRTGYFFLGWQLNGELYDFTTPVTGDITLVAAWVVVAPTPGVTEPKLPFVDISENDWYFNDVVKVYEAGIMNGTSATTFAPNETLSRAMMATILYRLSGETYTGENAGFLDVADGMWYTEAIAWAAAKGIVNGYSAESFGPMDNVTREQAYTMLYRYAQYKGMDVSAAEATVLNYVDTDSISLYAVPAMKWATGTGLVVAYVDGTVAPRDDMLRILTAVAVSRLMG